MKRPNLKSPVVRLFLLIAVSAASVQSCDIPGSSDAGKMGELRIAFAPNQESLTRSGLNIPDTSDFLLTIVDGTGKIVYDGKYGDSPESVTVGSGSCYVTVISEEFEKPAFSAPQFGDEQCVVVGAGNVVNVKLVCAQTNAGVKLKVDPGFLDAYPDGVLLLKSSWGRLVYGYSEKRIAYFRPGDVSLVLNEGKTDKVLMTRELKARDILELKVNVSSADPSYGQEDVAGGISIKVDTLRNWISDEFVIGGGSGKGNGKYDAMTVSEALTHAGDEDVWVSGYIVGGDLSSSSASFKKPFKSKSNMLLGPRSSTADKSVCLSVQLPSGEFRDALNLVDNPELLGRKVCVRGDIVEAYYGIPGIKNITEYELQ